MATKNAPYLYILAHKDKALVEFFKKTVSFSRKKGTPHLLGIPIYRSYFTPIHL